jgi:methylthioribose-1-phosphate isomerase
MENWKYDESPVRWDGERVVAVDQTALPARRVLVGLDTVDELVEAIGSLAIRGAPTLACAGAFGVALSVRVHRGPDGAVDGTAVRADAERIASARPTAADLGVGVRRALAALDGGLPEVLAAAHGLVAEIGRANRAAADHAADLLELLCPDGSLTVATHCNTGPLATARVGTALGVITVLAERGRIAEVLVGETRPLLQGARLTTLELAAAGIPHRLCVDAAVPAAMAMGMVQAVVVGADRITLDGDVVNKVGTYALAVAARRHALPFVVVAPSTTVDPATRSGADVVIEQRADRELLELRGSRLAPVGTRVFNPAFDVTPADLVTAVVTETGVRSGDERVAQSGRSRHARLPAVTQHC